MKFISLKFILGVSTITSVLMLISCSSQNDPTNYIGNINGTDWKGYISGQLTCNIEHNYAIINNPNKEVNPTYEAHNLIIPKYVKIDNQKYQVETIGEGAFWMDDYLTGSITFPPSIYEFQDGCFYMCSNITGELKLPENTQLLGEKCFGSCYNLTGKLDLSKTNVTELSNEAFNSDSGFTSLYLPKNLTLISPYTFANCSNISNQLILPSSLSYIDEGAFFNCSNLSGNINFSSSLISLSEGAFENCNNLQGDVYIPNSVLSIGDNAFSGCENLQNFIFNYYSNQSVYLGSKCFKTNNPNSIIGNNKLKFINISTNDYTNFSNNFDVEYSLVNDATNWQFEYKV